MSAAAGEQMRWLFISTEECRWPQPGCAGKQMVVDLPTEGASPAAIKLYIFQAHAEIPAGRLCCRA